MNEKEKLERQENLFNAALNNIKSLPVVDATEIIASLMLAISLLNIQRKPKNAPSNWDEAFQIIMEASKAEHESLPIALGKQALTLNMWVQTIKKN